MAKYKLQVLCDHFDSEAAVVELVTELKIKLGLNRCDIGAGTSVHHNELAVYSKLSDGTELRQVMGFIEIVFYRKYNAKDMSKKLRAIMRQWDLGEQGAWNLSAIIDWSGGFETQLSEIEKMSYLLGKIDINEEEIPF